MDIQWRIERFGELTVHELYALLRLRAGIFVVEQQCIYHDIDGLDQGSLHVLGMATDALVAYARILPPDAHDLPHIGRVVVHADLRGRGLAGQLMEQCLSVLITTYGSRRSALAAQAYLEGFYARYGYTRQGPDYLLDGIPHVDMRRTEV